MNRSTLGKEIKRDIASLRENYTKGGIRDEDLPSQPVPMFARWLDEAIESEVNEPNAMSLATVTPNGAPNVRIVLLKGIEGETLQFFTNYTSRKGDELKITPSAAVSFWWPELERQVRIRGRVEKLSRKENDSYFQSRPRESQIGAWVSRQSSPVENRDALKERADKISQKFGDDEVPTPDFWGGYSIEIEEIEFWQGRPGRLHDRILYQKTDGKWSRKRLQP
ncbi:pyridoxamine 5'-phosphate oxidase [Rhodohalobacter sp. SW132]|uniref:pyridoxamine 5'-phosphate oxidase n=1 Tax=Rhodohalobacter sp. SW132 TaxID=2293433 RepID=UPI0018F54A54|nr:pyridoxamine 5'-phosphate oxidase [Rhodohalobacter sp. SW132]